jgi:hypothetical protein
VTSDSPRRTSAFNIFSLASATARLVAMAEVYPTTTIPFEVVTLQNNPPRSSSSETCR